MKVFISADMEGISSIVSEEETLVGRSLYPAACAAMTKDVNAAIEGALKGGGTEVVVNDCHYHGLNMDPEALRPEARLIRGQPLPIMMSGLDDTFSAVFLVGYHAMKGTPCAVLDHVYTSQFTMIRINGRDIGELGLAAALSGRFSVPVALVSGDDKVAMEASAFMPDAEVVITKEAMGRTSANCLHPGLVREQIREKAQSAMGRLGAMRPFVLTPPLRLELAFTYTETADRALAIPGIERTGGRSIAYTGNSISEIARIMSALSHFIHT